MKFKNVIQKGFAALLLLVLMLSMTPSLFLHDAFANHKDEAVFCKAELKKGHCFHQQRINCHFDPLVVTVPYITYEIGYVLAQPVIHQSYYPFYLSSFSFSGLLGKDGRGPPSVG